MSTSTIEILKGYVANGDLQVTSGSNTENVANLESIKALGSCAPGCNFIANTKCDLDKIWTHIKEIGGGYLFLNEVDYPNTYILEIRKAGHYGIKSNCNSITKITLTYDNTVDSMEFNNVTLEKINNENVESYKTKSKATSSSGGTSITSGKEMELKEINSTKIDISNVETIDIKSINYDEALVEDCSDIIMQTESIGKKGITFKNCKSLNIDKCSFTSEDPYISIPYTYTKVFEGTEMQNELVKIVNPDYEDGFYNRYNDITYNIKNEIKESYKILETIENDSNGYNIIIENCNNVLIDSSNFISENSNLIIRNSKDVAIMKYKSTKSFNSIILVDNENVLLDNIEISNAKGTGIIAINNNSIQLMNLSLKDNYNDVLLVHNKDVLLDTVNYTNTTNNAQVSYFNNGIVSGVIRYENIKENAIVSLLDYNSVNDDIIISNSKNAGLIQRCDKGVFIYTVNNCEIGLEFNECGIFKTTEDDKLIITDNAIDGCKYDGLRLVKSYNIDLINSNSSNNSDGLYLIDSHCNNIINSNFTNNNKTKNSDVFQYQGNIDINIDKNSSLNEFMTVTNNNPNGVGFFIHRNSKSNIIDDKSNIDNRLFQDEDYVNVDHHRMDIEN